LGTENTGRQLDNKTSTAWQAAINFQEWRIKQGETDYAALKREADVLASKVSPLNSIRQSSQGRVLTLV